MSNKPPKIVIPGLNRGAGVPAGFMLGRLPGTAQGPAQLLPSAQLRKLGVATTVQVTGAISQSISVVQSEITSLSTAVSSSLSSDASQITSLSSAVSTVDGNQNTSLSQISSSLSGAISSTSSLSTGVSTVVSGSISAVNSRVDSLSTAVGGGGGTPGGSSGQIQYNNAGAFGGFTASGDVTIVPSTGVATIKTNVALAGSPTTTTQAAGDNSTKIATDAFVTTAIANAIAGINPAVAVQAATTAASNTSSYTYNNGASGVGATLTGVANTALTVDGFTFSAVGQRLLVKNDTQSPSGAFNGVYYVTQVQTTLLPVILTRALDYGQPSDINNTGAIPVVNGTLNAATSWLLTSTVNTVGTDPLTYIQFTVAPGSIPVGANPTATAGPAAVNGSATTFMRSDAAPAVQLGTNAAPGLLQGDGLTTSVSGGIVSVIGGGGTAVSPYEAYVAKPTLASFSWINQGSVTAADDTFGIAITAPASGSNANALLVKSAPGLPFDVITRVQIAGVVNNYPGIGLCLRNSSNGRLLNFYWHGFGNPPGLAWERWTSPTVYSANAGGVGTLYAFPSGIIHWLRYNVTSSSITLYVSDNGHNWSPALAAEAPATFITAAGGSIDQIGIVNRLDNGALISVVNVFTTTLP